MKPRIEHRVFIIIIVVSPLGGMRVNRKHGLTHFELKLPSTEHVIFNPVNGIKNHGNNDDKKIRCNNGINP